MMMRASDLYFGVIRLTPTKASAATASAGPSTHHFFRTSARPTAPRSSSPPLSQNQLVLPAMLRPAPVWTAQPTMAVQSNVVAQPLATPMAEQPIAQPVMLEPEQTGYTLDSGDKLRVVVFGQDGLSASYSV